MRRLFNLLLIIVLLGCLFSGHHAAINFESNFTVQLSDMDNPFSAEFASCTTDDSQLNGLIYGYQTSEPLLPANSQIQPISSINLLALWRTFPNEYKLMSKRFIAFLPKPHCLRIILEGLYQTSFHYAKEYYIYTLRQLLI